MQIPYKCTHTHPMPAEMAHLTPAVTVSVITLRGDEKDSTLHQWHFCAFDLIIHVLGEEQQRPQTGATMKVWTSLSDKGTMISARSQCWCHVFFSVWLHRVGQWKKKSSSEHSKSSLVWPISCYSSCFSLKGKKKEYPSTWYNFLVECESA